MALQRQIDHRAGSCRLLGEDDAILSHQTLVACQHGLAIHLDPQTTACQFLHLGHPVTVRGTTPGGENGAGNGVGGELLGLGGQFQQLLLTHPHRGDFGDSKTALGQGARLIKDHRVRLGQRLQIVAALDQDALAGGSADTAEEAEGDGDDQRAGAGHHQEVQRPQYPGAPGTQPHQGGQHGKGYGAQHHGGGVIPGEFRNKVLRLGLFGSGVFHQVQNFGHGGLAEGAAHLHPQQTAEVDTAADHLVPGRHIPGHGLAGKGGGIQGGGALHHGAVQGHPLSGTDDDDLVHRHLLRVHGDHLAIPLHVGAVGADVHELGDGGAAAADGHTLEQLAHLVEEHDGHAFPVFSTAEGADGGQSHEKVFVKYLAVFDVPDCLPQDVPADEGVGQQIEKKFPPGRQGSQSGHRPNHGKQHCAA